MAASSRCLVLDRLIRINPQIGLLYASQYRIDRIIRSRIHTISPCLQKDQNDAALEPKDDMDKQATTMSPDISRLPSNLYRRLKGEIPTPVQASDFEGFRRYLKKSSFNRKLYARFGEKSGVHAGSLWPDEEYVKVCSLPSSI